MKFFSLKSNGNLIRLVSSPNLEMRAIIVSTEIIPTAIPTKFGLIRFATKIQNTVESRVFKILPKLMKREFLRMSKFLRNRITVSHLNQQL